MSPEAIQERRTALAAQCPPPLARDEGAGPIHITRWGGAGPRVLVIHGGVQGGAGGGPATFARQQTLASEGWRLEVVDRPGFGGSPSRGVDDQEADAPWIASMLGDGAHLVGHSWGGALALLASARRPEAVRSLTLIEPALHGLLAGAPEVGRNPAAQADLARTGGLLFSSRSPAEYALAFAKRLSEPNGNPRNAAAEALERAPDKAACLGCALLQSRMAPPQALIRAAQAVASAAIPVLVITGGWSPSFDVVGEVAARLTQGRHLVVRSPNHFVQLSSADAFNGVLVEFLQESEHRRALP